MSNNKKFPSRKTPKSSNIIDLFNGKPIKNEGDNLIVRLSPELDGMKILYSNESDPERLFSISIVCWSIDKNGNIDAMVPWLTRLVRSRQISDPLNGRWEGYFDPIHNTIMMDPPQHKVTELKESCNYFMSEKSPDLNQIIQEIPDTIGTHASFLNQKKGTFSLEEVVSWQLMGNGNVDAMVSDPSKVSNIPILAGDQSLYSTRSKPDFFYFFHYHIANKIKQSDPEILAYFKQIIDLEQNNA